MWKILFLFLTILPAWATITSTMVWELRQTATAGNLNGGGFKPGASGTDYSLQDAAQYNLTSVTTAGADGTLLSASAATDMVGNVAHVVSGANFTAGWYEIISVVAGVSITLDRNAATAAGASGVVNIGGAMSMGSTLDSDLFSAVVAGNKIWMKNSQSYTGGENITGTAATTTLNITWDGYNSTRGDAPTGSNRPKISLGTTTATMGTAWNVEHIWIAGAGVASQVLALGADCRMYNCKVTCSSTAANKDAILLGSGNSILDCEVVSQNGRCIDGGGGSNDHIYGCYLHDSDLGVNCSAGSGIVVNFCVFENMKTAGYTSSATAARNWIKRCTFYGANTTAVGIGCRTTGATAGTTQFLNNIYYGLITGIEIATVQQDAVYENFNDFNNNTTARTLCAVGPNSITTAPAFAGATQITGSTATTSGSTLTQSGGDFSAVTDNIDYVRVVSGTGVTVSTYLITGHAATTLTTNNALGTSSGGDVVYVVYTGHNFYPTANLVGFPSVLNSSASETTGFPIMGAIQKGSASAVGSSSVFLK